MENAGTTHASGEKKDESASNALTILFLGLCLLRHPLLLCPPFHHTASAYSFIIADTAALGAAALALICVAAATRGLVRSRWDARVAAAVGAFSLFCVFNFLRYGNDTIREFLVSTAWVSIPWAAYLHRRAFAKLLGPWLAILWALNALHAVPQLFDGAQEVGVPGNRNWHGILIVATTPFAALYAARLSRRLGFGGKKAWIAIVPVAIPMAMALYRCQSRGANLALAVAAAFLLFAWGLSSPEKKTRRTAWISAVAVAVVLALSAGTLAVSKNETLSKALAEDVRPPLWRGAANMMLSHPLAGVGQPQYESSFAAYVPLSRFLRSKQYALRSNHPHNHFLYLGGSFGIIALMAALFLYFVPLAAGAAGFRRMDTVAKLYLFAYTALLTHSAFDLVASRWPTGIALLALQGVLLGEAARRRAEEKDGMETAAGAGTPLKIPALAAALSMLLATAWIIWTNFGYSSKKLMADTFLEMGVAPLALNALDESLSIHPTPVTAYNAGIISLSRFHDPYLALKYFRLQESLPDRITARSDFRMAECLEMTGRPKEALRYLEKELVVHPVSITTLHAKMTLERKLGMDAASAATARRLLAALKFKGLDIRDLRAILADPDLDGHFHKIKARHRR